MPAPAAGLQLMLTIRTQGRTTEPARELAGKPAQTGTPTALGQACHVAVHAVTVAVELGDAGMHSVKRLPGQLTGSHGSSTAALRN